LIDFAVMSSVPPLNSDSFQRTFLLFAVGAISFLFLWMVEPFLMALLLGAITAGLSQPIHGWLVQVFRGRAVLASAILILGMILLVIGPASALVGVVVAQAVEITQEIRPWVATQIANPEGFSVWLDKLPFHDQIPFDSLLPSREKLIAAAGDAVQSAGSIIVDGLAAAGRGTARFILQLFIFLYAVFFFLLSGRETLNRILHLSPLNAEDESEIMDRFLSVTRATLKGSLLIGGIQGFLVGVAFAIAGVPGAAFWGTIVVVFSVIPGIGGPIVWIPAVLWLVSTGATTEAGLLAAWCGLVVGSIDNVLRPRLVGSDAKMSDLMIMISTLGGIVLFGPVGFIVGPIVAALFVTFWDVYGRAFADSLPPVRG
jgi:predicted PurR-regulated permease PerM